MTNKLRRPATGQSGAGRKQAVAAAADPSGQADRVVAVMARAREIGLTASKDGRISGRVSAELIAQAKARTGIRSDTELLAFALANVAIEDDFVRVFHAVNGTVDPDLDLDF